ncbi:xanthine dehydrogenase family protein molybdopterin-binding subunit [Myxosarcina sp. GI1]|uniref:xanthine dehydrogenase family protein molybdopterin-binding subunit n=1 Tax=Myxosarcina sp. GI1 TaxID=1541065 RepID=UPI00055C94B6|nr:xanthine dehydrogenase family protein molybdopterin-binding subunit [Myxosarcina sp. GI1]
MNRVIGQAKKRVTGKLKVTGGAKYAAEFPIEKVTYAVLTTSNIAKGRITNIDTKEAQKVPGVIAILTNQNAPKLPFKQIPKEQRISTAPSTGNYPQTLYTDRIYFYGQPVAVTVAETLEQAEQAASLVKVDYQSEEHQVSVETAAAKGQLIAPPNKPGEHSRGDAVSALDRAAAKIDASYTVPTEHHNPIEPHATIAVWQGDKLKVYDKTQWVASVQQHLGAVFGIPQKNVEVISPFVGGAFGCAGRTWQQTTLAPIAAKVVNRPVKLVLSRQQMFSLTGHRPYTTQRVAMGADRDGNITAIVHEATGEVAQFETYTERVLSASRFLYSSPNVQTKYRLARLDISTPTFMRAPGEAQGLYALESAIDELAYEVGIDPLELRLKNYTEQDPESNLPWSEKALRECYEKGAERFGWSKRNPQPRSQSENGILIGYGMATTTYPMVRLRAVARVRINADGTALVQSAASDMGPGTYTTMTIIAAEALGIDSDRITFELGDSSFPYAPPHGGSMTVASVGSAVKAACEEARSQALALAKKHLLSPLATTKDNELKVENGRLFSQQNPSKGMSYSEILQRANKEYLEAEQSSEPGKEKEQYSMHSFGAHFVEVRVDEMLGDIQIARVVSAIDVGKIINPKTSTSQTIGGVVGGIGMVLHEHTFLDDRFGNYLNANLGEYLVPVNADIPTQIEAIFCGEPDYHANPLGARGIGEIALVGVAPAVANAIYHATGKRIRDLPITPDKLL